MSNTDNIDRFGHCSLCHKNMITKRVVDGKVIDMFLPDHDHADFLLNDGSVMKVCMCKTCKSKYELTDPKIYNDIMEAVQKGWELETKVLVADDKFPDWTQEHADGYLEKMNRLKIKYHADNLSHRFIKEKSEEFSKKFNDDIIKNRKSKDKK